MVKALGAFCGLLCMKGFFGAHSVQYRGLTKF